MADLRGEVAVQARVKNAGSAVQEAEAEWRARYLVRNAVAETASSDSDSYSGSARPLLRRRSGGARLVVDPVRAVLVIPSS